MRAKEFMVDFDTSNSALDEMAGRIHVGIRQALKDKGYKYLGSGIDKQAYLEPGTGQVLVIFGYRGQYKNFSPDQRMFIDWISYCDQHQDNPALPKFSGFESFQFRGKNYIQARMEPLKEIPSQMRSTVAYIDLALLHGHGDFKEALAKLARHGYYDEVKDQINEYTVKKVIKLLGGEANANNLFNTVLTVRDFGAAHGYDLDLHGGNYMRRPDGTIVVNDPFVIWLRS